MEKHIKLPLSKDEAKKLRSGDTVLLSGMIYAARDAAHKRISDKLDENGFPEDLSVISNTELNELRKKAERILPIKLEGNLIYYMGPSPARPGKVIGSVGPTTAGRMDRYTPRLLDLGLAGTIGKGRRSEDVIKGIRRNSSVYFAAVGGAGALLSKCIISSEVIAYDDLGPEAIRRLEVEDLPVIVVVDCEGNNLYMQ